HALERLDEGYDLIDVAEEYGMLRTCILRRLEGALRPAPHGEIVAFNQAIDHAVARSVASYMDARSRTLRALDRIGTAAAGAEDLTGFLRELLEVLLATTPAVDSVSVLLWEGRGLRVRAAAGHAMQGTEGTRVALGECFAGRVAQARAPLLV